MAQQPNYPREQNRNFSQRNFQEATIVSFPDFDKITPEELNKQAETFGKNFQKIKTNQIRKVFAEVNKLRVSYRNKTEWKDLQRELILLKPKLAYAAGRQNAVKPFQEMMSSAIDSVNRSVNKNLAMENFFALIESVVAYHKFYGGRDN